MVSPRVQEFVEGGRLAPEEVFELYAFLCANVVNDMMSEHIRDPDYVKSEGLPTRADFVELMVDQALTVIPEMLEDNYLPSAGMPEELKGKPAFQRMIALYFRNFVEENQKLIQLKYTPS